MSTPRKVPAPRTRRRGRPIGSKNYAGAERGPGKQCNIWLDAETETGLDVLAAVLDLPRGKLIARLLNSGRASLSKEQRARYDALLAERAADSRPAPADAAE